ncbi:hypothetical protein DFH09DRAFT_1107552 [Mycena vulgaris]|nr:hypothetical protein DFH09DRAFT_1107552 [Mycena vulgaris]
MVFLTSPLFVALAVASLATVVSAHAHPLPGSIEFYRRAKFHKVARRSLASCHEELAQRGGVYERAAESHRRKRGLPANVPYKRDAASVLATDHKSALTGVTNNTDAATLFTGNASCVLAPEVTQGPYSNSTGVYSGIVTGGNDVGTEDATNISQSELRTADCVARTRENRIGVKVILRLGPSNIEDQYIYQTQRQDQSEDCYWAILDRTGTSAN